MDKYVQKTEVGRSFVAMHRDGKKIDKLGEKGGTEGQFTATNVKEAPKPGGPEKEIFQDGTEKDDFSLEDDDDDYSWQRRRVVQDEETTLDEGKKKDKDAMKKWAASGGHVNPPDVVARFKAQRAEKKQFASAKKEAKNAKGYVGEETIDENHDAVFHQMIHAVTGYDRKQASSKRKGHYYNPNALGLYMGAADRAHKEMKAGKSTGDAINSVFNGGLARHLHKALKTGGTDVDTTRRIAYGEETVDEADRRYHVQVQPYSLEKNEVGKSLGTDTTLSTHSSFKAAGNRLGSLISGKRKGIPQSIAGHGRGYKINVKDSTTGETFPRNAAKGVREDVVDEAKMSTADSHQHRIARDTVKNPNKGKFLGGPSAEEAEKMLRGKFKYDDKAIAKLKEDEVKPLQDILAEGGPTRKHFQEVANTVRAIEDPKKRQEFADHHAHIFAGQNPRFDHNRFHAACGTNAGGSKE